MKKQVILTIDSDYSDEMIKGVLLDSFHEFSSHRQTTQEYVNKRYSWMDDEEKENKCNQIEHRKEVAKQLHQSSFDMTIIPEMMSKPIQIKVKEFLELINLMTEKEKDSFSETFSNKKITEDLIDEQIEYCKKIVNGKQNKFNPQEYLKKREQK